MERNSLEYSTVKPVLRGQSKIVKTNILMTNGSLVKVESIAECSPWSILQYFWPAWSDYWSWKPIFGLFESGSYCIELNNSLLCYMGGSRGETMGSRTPGKSQVAIDFLRNTGKEPPRKAIGPLGSNCFSRKVRSALCEICWWLKKCQDPPDEIFWISPWVIQ